MENLNKFENFLKLKTEFQECQFLIFHNLSMDLFGVIYQDLTIYLSRFNDYRAQLNQGFQKWKVCEVIALGLNAEFQDHIEFMCPGGLLG